MREIQTLPIELHALHAHMYILYTLSIDTAGIITSQKIYASIELPPVIHIAACLTMLGPKRS